MKAVATVARRIVTVDMVHITEKDSWLLGLFWNVAFRTECWSGIGNRKWALKTAVFIIFCHADRCSVCLLAHEILLACSCSTQWRNLKDFLESW